MVQYAVRSVIWRTWWSFTSKCPYRLKFFVWCSGSTMCRRCLNNCGERVFVCLKVSEHFSYVHNRFFAIQYACVWYFIEYRPRWSIFICSFKVAKRQANQFIVLFSNNTFIWFALAGDKFGKNYF
jgi:hypothetical protein